MLSSFCCSSIHIGNASLKTGYLTYIILLLFLSTHECMIANTALRCRLIVRAHSYLAEYSLCTHSNGALLSHTINRMLSYMKSENCHSKPASDQLIQQAVFCLYGHPNKKVLPSRLQTKCFSIVKLPFMMWLSIASGSNVKMYHICSCPFFSHYNSCAYFAAN